MAKARFIYAIPDKNADLFYAAKFKAPDPVIFFEKGKKRYLVMSDLEFDRARKQSSVDRVLSLAKYECRVRRQKPKASLVDVIHAIFSDHGIRDILVPASTSFSLVDGLRKKGYRIEAGPEPFYQERYFKTAEERRCILESQRQVFAAMKIVRDVLSESRIKGDRLVYRGRDLTSDSVRMMINIFLLERGFIAEDTIISCGVHAIDPHDVGSGPLTPHSSIIVDIFPKSMKTGYFGDSTRTFCRGRASDALREMYATVKTAQEIGIEMVKDGVNGRTIHETIIKFFAGRGYPTGEKGARRQGFIHGTGHSIGLECHEEPLRINPRDHVLKAGNVMSVEPGLYYKGIGGVRIEDLVYVKKGGCEILGKFPKSLEII